jgi:hypothetical protein
MAPPNRRQFNASSYLFRRPSPPIVCCSQIPTSDWNGFGSVPGWRHIGAAFEVGRRSVGAHFGGAKYAHALLGFFLLFARSEEIDANLIANATLAPRVGYPRDEEMPERSSGWGRKFDEPIALPGGGKLVPHPPPRS